MRDEMTLYKSNSEAIKTGMQKPSGFLKLKGKPYYRLIADIMTDYLAAYPKITGDGDVKTQTINLLSNKHVQHVLEKTYANNPVETIIDFLNLTAEFIEEST